MKRLLWYAVSWFCFESGILLPYGFKRSMLRSFGARIGQGVVIKPHVQIKYPWKLSVADHAWIGEHVWIDNLDEVTIGKHACISQGALILCGNHDFTRTSFDLMVKPIQIGDGAWIGARTTVTQGVEVGRHAVLTVGSIATSDLEANGIYQGNPAVKVKIRVIKA
jgi:putative colanic acid biosynthesis acetyltransferase WcaF